ALGLAPGCIATSLGTYTTRLVISGSVTIAPEPAAFLFTSGTGFAVNTSYTILSAPNLSRFSAHHFTGNSLNGVSPTFSIVGNELQVCFHQ
ncbi:MAG TPA: hypothetical protein VIJ16_01230, partial [Gemmatimonadaceae bacterium]